ncbi:hypothetical protein EI94DRAFT_1721914 [Lactarius quietus]|nr:hypothetical protein EI94DRAFT_1721914 [Lactarius quietus]
MSNITTCLLSSNCTWPTECTTVCANDDVLGIGIRINFYSTMVLLAVIPQTPHTEELLNVLYANTGIAGLGLLVTAIQQTASRQLSLFHAIFVQHILFFLGIGIAPVGKYNWSRSRIIMGVVIQFILVVAFTAWALYLWVHIDNFGSQPNLNDEVKYVLMFVNIKATAAWLRGIWITTLVASALVLIIKFGLNGLALYTMRHDEEGEETGESERGWYFFISLPQFVIAIYSTVMLELTVQRNSLQHGGIVGVNNTWAFGQTLSVVMIFANINEIVNFVVGYISRRRKHSHELQVEAQQASNDTEMPQTSAPYQSRRRPGSRLSARDPSQMKSSTEHELLELNKENTHVQVSEITLSENPQTRDQPVGTLR